MTPCHNCQGPHPTYRCPEIWKLLRAPEVCVDCGDASPTPICKACMEYEKKAHTSPTFRREIVYEPAVHDYAMYLDGELVGFQRTYRDAEITLDTLIFELTTGAYFREAA